MALAARPKVAEVLRDRVRRAVVPVLEGPVEGRAARPGVASVYAPVAVDALACLGRNRGGDSEDDEGKELHDEEGVVGWVREMGSGLVGTTFWELLWDEVRRALRVVFYTVRSYVEAYFSAGRRKQCTVRQVGPYGQ